MADNNKITYGSDNPYYVETKKQLDSWGCKYHNLSVGEKPHYDLIICDKAINSNRFFENPDSIYRDRQ